MDEFRLGMLLSTLIEAMAVNAEIEMMKMANAAPRKWDEHQPFSVKDFKEKADHLWALSNQARNQ